MSAPINILIRADAARALGTGHFARASSVADALTAAAGTHVVLATAEAATVLVPAYFPQGIDVLALAEGADSATDVLDKLERQGRRPDVIYLDHYGDVAEWEAAAASRRIGLLVLDDLDAGSAADVLVRPHGGPRGTGDAIVLNGPAWLPLSRHVTALAGGAGTEAGERLRVNVCFGGTDPTGETAKAIAALATLPEYDADIVIGPGAAVDASLLAQAEALRRTAVHHAPSQAELAKLMAGADVAVGAGGVMLWERLCLGLPSLVIAAADNQRPQIDAMVAEGAIDFLGDHQAVAAAAIEQGLSALAADQGRRASMREAGRRLVDGRGSQRIAAWLRALALTARDVKLGDGPALFEWRTDDSNWQHNWDGADKPSLDAHMAWLAKRIDSADCAFRIIERGGEPVGVVRFDLSDAGRAAYLSIYLVPAMRGQRLGLPVFFAAERALRRSHPAVERIVSRIHQGNAASVQLHRDAGFNFAQSPERADWFDAVKSLT